MPDVLFGFQGGCPVGRLRSQTQDHTADRSHCGDAANGLHDGQVGTALHDPHFKEQ